MCLNPLHLHLKASRTRTTITGLGRNVEYAVRIAYETGDGVGDFSTPWVKATTLDVLLVGKSVQKS